MPIGQELGGFPTEDMTQKELIDHVGNMQKTIEYYLGGQIDSTNAREFGGFFIKPTMLASKSGNVGLHSGAGTNPVRIWAGSTDMNSAPFRVYDDGSVILTKGTISWEGIPLPAPEDLGALPVNSPMLTHITATGIYTGTVTANQINAGELNGIIYNQYNPNTPNRRLSIRPSGISGTPDVTFWNDVSTTLPRGALYLANVDIADGTGYHDYFSIWGPDRMQITGGYIWFNTGTVDFGNATVKGTNFSATAKFG